MRAVLRKIMFLRNGLYAHTPEETRERGRNSYSIHISTRVSTPANPSLMFLRKPEVEAVKKKCIRKLCRDYISREHVPFKSYIGERQNARALVRHISLNVYNFPAATFSTVADAGCGWGYSFMRSGYSRTFTTRHAGKHSGTRERQPVTRPPRLFVPASCSRARDR